MSRNRYFKVVVKNLSGGVRTLAEKIVQREIYVRASNGNLVMMKLEMRPDGVSLFIPGPVCNEDATKTLEGIVHNLNEQVIIHEEMRFHDRVDRVSFKRKSS